MNLGFWHVPKRMYNCTDMFTALSGVHLVLWIRI